MRENEPVIDDRNEEEEDLLSQHSDHTSNTSFYGDISASNRNTASSPSNQKRQWKRTNYKVEGRVLILGEWISKTECRRAIVIGPDWPCVIIAYFVIVIPSVFVYLYLLKYLAEKILFWVLLSSTLLGLTVVFLGDPGLVRKYHHARSRKWTFCDHCQSFRPPKTVHCSTCQVCIADYDHHCPWTGKCVGRGNLRLFQFFVISLTWLIILYIVLAILLAVRVNNI